MLAATPRWATLPTSRPFHRGLYRRICASMVPPRGDNVSLWTSLATLPARHTLWSTHLTLPGLRISSRRSHRLWERPPLPTASGSKSGSKRRSGGGSSRGSKMGAAWGAEASGLLGFWVWGWCFLRFSTAAGLSMVVRYIGSWFCCTIYICHSCVLLTCWLCLLPLACAPTSAVLSVIFRLYLAFGHPAWACVATLCALHFCFPTVLTRVSACSSFSRDPRGAHAHHAGAAWPRDFFFLMYHRHYRRRRLLSNHIVPTSIP
jgi:hypothetical protein